MGTDPVPSAPRGGLGSMVAPSAGCFFMLQPAPGLLESNVQVLVPRSLTSPELVRGFPGGASGKEPSCQRRKHKRLWVQPLDQEDPLEEGMAIHSSFLAWRIPRTEEPGGPESTGSKRVRHS